MKPGGVRSSSKNSVTKINWVDLEKTAQLRSDKYFFLDINKLYQAPSRSIARIAGKPTILTRPFAGTKKPAGWRPAGHLFGF
jgi:hypothetical protein